jgi:hypothetical protein
VIFWLSSLIDNDFAIVLRLVLGIMVIEATSSIPQSHNIC